MTPYNQLRTFIEVMRAGSISAAAKTLAITQPAASMHIKTLENVLDKKLFERVSKTIEPTQTAIDLFKDIENGFIEVEQGFQNFQARSNGVNGVLKMIVPNPFLRRKFWQNIPQLIDAGLELKIRIGNKSEIYTQLLDGTVDLAITASKPDNIKIGYQEIFEENLILITSRSQADIITYQGLKHSLRQTRLITYDSDLPMIRQYLRQLNLSQSDIKSQMSVSDLDTIQKLVIEDIGWSVLPDYVAQDALEKGELVQHASDIHVTNQLYLAWLKSSLRHPRIAFARTQIIQDLN